MAKTKISEFSSTPANNTDIDSINIAEGCAPSGINDAIRELMAQLKDFQTGAAGDSFNGPVGTSTAAAGAFTTLAASGAVTLSGGTANGVAYLNGSKVLTTGSALVFDGSRLGINIASPTLSLEIGGSNATGYIHSGVGVLSIGSKNNYPVTFDVNNAEQMRLTSTGLGIGTSSPAVKLEVAGDARLTGANPSLSAVPSSTGFFIDNRGVGKSTFFRVSSASAIDTTAATLDSSGNLGLGVTPSAWNSSYRAFQNGNASLMSRASGDDSYWNGNAFFDGNWKYIYNGNAQRYEMGAGRHVWYTAPSGTAGNAISFTQAMTLTATGDTDLKLTTANTGSGATDGLLIRVNSTGSESYLWSYENGALVFGTNNTERARITSSGNLLVGTTTTDPGYGNTAIGVRVSNTQSNFSASTTDWVMTVNQNTADGGTRYLINFRNSNVNIGGITGNGTSTTYATSSDYRLKENIQPMQGALATVSKLQPCTYTWKSTGEQSQGFIAHELAEVVPDAVVGEKDAVDAEGHPVYQGIDTSFLVATLTAAIQELKAEFDAYKASHP